MCTSPCHSKRIYCAGPLFNPKEQEEMEAIATALERNGYDVFLPHRDGLELANVLPALINQGLSPETAAAMINRAIFALDVYQILHSDGVLVNINGRVPDEGAMVEAGIAWTAEREIVLFKSDSRSLVQGHCNPLVMGLADFLCATQYEEIPHVFDKKFSASQDRSNQSLPSHFAETSEQGAMISSCLLEGKSADDLSYLLIQIFGRSQCPSNECPSCTEAHMQP